MREVDQHILEAAKLLDCSFSDEHPTIGSWSPTDVMEFIIRALWLIVPSSKADLSSCKLPLSINGRFSMANKVADRLNNLRVSPGIKLTEQSLLYGEVSEYRRLFLDVIRLFPNEKDIGEENEQEDDLLVRAANYNAQREIWTPQYCRHLQLENKGIFWYPSMGQPDLFPFNSKAQISADPRTFVVNMLGHGNIQVTIKPSLVSKLKLPPKPVKTTTTEVIEKDPKKKEIERLKEELYQSEVKAQEAKERLSEVKKDINYCLCERDQPEVEHIPKELVEVLENTEARKELIDALKAVTAKVGHLELEWEAARKKTAVELEEAKQLYGHGNRIERLRKKKEDYLRYEREAGEQKEQADFNLQRLEQKMSKMTNENGENRDKITKRLFEMMQSLQKQQDELNKVLAENGALQKEMNWTSQALYRSFSIIEDALYKIHESYKGGQMYRAFGRINLTCTSSVSLIEKNGAIIRQTEKLTDQLEVEKQKCFSARLERMMCDLDLVRQENSELAKQIRH